MKSKTTKKEKKEVNVQEQPLILRYHRLLSAFAKSDDERDFYLDRMEGFIIYANLEKNQKDLELLYQEIVENQERYHLIPKLTFYEAKKIMEGFVNDKVYDIDIKEKLNDIIQSKGSRENFLEFIYDTENELEKWQTYYQERFRIRIIEWLREHHFCFVFEEDLEMDADFLFRLKKMASKNKLPKELQEGRKYLIAKAKSYYSNDALHPRPKRGRPPKQVEKAKIEQKFSLDSYANVPVAVRPFLFLPDVSAHSMATFSSKYDNEEELLNKAKTANPHKGISSQLEVLSQRVQEFHSLSKKLKTDTLKEI